MTAGPAYRVEGFGYRGAGREAGKDEGGNVGGFFVGHG
jgi:hypothetical protein